MFDVVVSATFVKQFRSLAKPAQKRVRAALDALAVDPLRPRPGADIKQLHATDPPKHRIRVGELRVIYLVEGRRVKVIDVFARERAYRE